jgi:hypothetical protein
VVAELWSEYPTDRFLCNALFRTSSTDNRAFCCSAVKCGLILWISPEMVAHAADIQMSTTSDNHT